MSEPMLFWGKKEERVKKYKLLFFGSLGLYLLALVCSIAFEPEIYKYVLGLMLMLWVLLGAIPVTFGVLLWRASNAMLRITATTVSGRSPWGKTYQFPVQSICEIKLTNGFGFKLVTHAREYIVYDFENSRAMCDTLVKLKEGRLVNPYKPATQKMSGNSSISKTGAVLITVFLGTWGVHRFMAGKVGTGLLWLFTLGLLGFGWLVDVINVASGNFTTADGQVWGSNYYVPVPVYPPAPASSPADELKKYKELLDQGAITQEEYDAKKQQLLG